MSKIFLCVYLVAAGCMVDSGQCTLTWIVILCSETADG